MNAETQTENNGTEPAGTEAEPTEAEPTPEAAEDTEEPHGGNAEAAKYRRRARAAEIERDSLRDQLAAVQRAEVERVAGATLADGADLWAAVDLDATLAEDGTVDPAKVRDAVRDLLTAHPHWARPGPVKPGSLASGAAARSTDPRGWGAALKRNA